MNDHDMSPDTEAGYFGQAESLGADRHHAERVLRSVARDAGEQTDARVYQLAYEQLVADLNQNPA